MWLLFLSYFLTFAWGYKGFDFSSRTDIKTLRAQHIHTGMAGRLSGRVLLRFYVGETTADAQEWVLKMIEHYGIYTPLLDEELTKKYGSEIYVAQERIYFTYRDNVGYCVDAYRDMASEAFDIFASLEEMLVLGDVDHTLVPSIVRRTSVDKNGNTLETSHFHIELPVGVRMLYRGGMVDQQATFVGRSKNPNYVGFQKLPSHIYLFDSYGYGSAFVHDNMGGFILIRGSGVNPQSPLQKIEGANPKN
jgi:hypothetical protein